MHERLEEGMCSVIQRSVIRVGGDAVGVEGDDCVDVRLGGLLCGRGSILGDEGGGEEV